MDRRKFLRTSIFGVGALSLGEVSLAKSKKNAEKVEKVRLQSFGTVKEEARILPVFARTDILVIGGGPAGVAAAICAAREGAKVILVEKNGYLGGLWTGGLVLPVLATHGVGKNGNWDKAVEGISTEICDRLFSMGMCINPLKPKPDPEATKYLLEEMLDEAGVELIYFATATDVIMSGDRISSVILHSKSGRLAIECNLVIDCSGDGDIIEWAGESFHEMKYQIGIMHRLGNCDRIDKTAVGYTKQKIGSETPIEGVNMVHMKGEPEQDGLDIINLTRLQKKYRKQIWEQTEALKKQPGYEHVYLLGLAEMLGVRVTRVLDPIHLVTLDESMTGTVYKDVIGMAGACDPNLWWRGQKISNKKRPVWQIPYSAITPKRCPNLLTAGRCFGFDEGLAYDAREIGTCFVTGQAAGVAASIAIDQRQAVQDIDIKRLQEKLVAQKVRLDF